MTGSGRTRPSELLPNSVDISRGELMESYYSGEEGLKPKLYSVKKAVQR